MAKPGGGANVADVTTRATHDGDELIIDGQTGSLANAFYSDFVICSARVGATGLSHVLIDRHEHGYEVMNLGKSGTSLPSAARIAFAETRVPVPIC